MELDVIAAPIDIAQPRWVGPAYWAAQPRVAILMINPGGGGSRSHSSTDRTRAVIHSFAAGSGTFDEVLEHQAQDIPSWGRGRFAAFYLAGLGLALNKIALANVAWCATLGDRYPANMLKTCFSRHTGRLLQILSPDFLLVSGSSAHDFVEQIGLDLPGAKIVPTLHYAHRKGQAAQTRELERVRSQLRNPSDPGSSPFRGDSRYPLPG